MELLKNVVLKYGFRGALGLATLDGYRRQVQNDKSSKVLEEIQKQKDLISENNKISHDKVIEELSNITANKAANLRYSELANQHKKTVENYNTWLCLPTEYNKNEILNINKKLEGSLNEINRLNISDLFIKIYDNYIEFIFSLTPDKIVCLFNIIMGSLLLSSFFSVLSILLSENIINRISILEKYPKILYLLNLRNKLNKKLIKTYLMLNLIIILLSISGNIWMFFI
jgi:hypothetical protein